MHKWNGIMSEICFKTTGGGKGDNVGDIINCLSLYCVYSEYIQSSTIVDYSSNPEYENG